MNERYSRPAAYLCVKEKLLPQTREEATTFVANMPCNLERIRTSTTAVRIYEHQLQHSSSQTLPVCLITCSTSDMEHSTILDISATGRPILCLSLIHISEPTRL